MKWVLKDNSRDTQNVKTIAETFFTKHPCHYFGLNNTLEILGDFLCWEYHENRFRITFLLVNYLYHFNYFTTQLLHYFKYWNYIKGSTRKVCGHSLSLSNYGRLVVLFCNHRLHINDYTLS